MSGWDELEKRDAELARVRAENERLANDLATAHAVDSEGWEKYNEAHDVLVRLHVVNSALSDDKDPRR